MRLSSVRIKKLGHFEDFYCDLDAIAGTVIAVTGKNGSGKSTFLELGIPGALYRDTPTRGSLTKLSSARDSMLEVTIVTDQRWTFRHLVDGIGRKSEAIVLDANGQPAIDASKVTKFDGWVRGHMTAPDVLFASAFCAQKSEGFAGYKPSERKSVLLRTLGLERLETLSEQARARASVAKKDHAVAASRVADQQVRLSQFIGDRPLAPLEVLSVQARDSAVIEALALGRSEEDLRASEACESRLAKDVEFCREELALAEASAAKVAEAKQAAAAEAAIVADLKGKRGVVVNHLAELTKRVANNRAVIVERDAILAATTKVPQLKTAIEDVTIRLNDARSRETAWKDRCDAVARDDRAAAERVQSVERQLSGAAEVREHAATAPDIRERVALARSGLEQAEDKLREIEGSALVGAEGRIEQLRGGLIEITQPSTSAGLREIATETLATDDQSVKDAAERPTLLATARGVVAEARTRLQKLEVALRAAESAEARVPALDELEAQLVAAEAAKRATEEAAREWAARRPPSPLSAGFEEVIAGHRAEIARLEPFLVKAEPLTRAETRLEELLPQLANAERDLALLDEQIAGRPTIVVPEAVNPAPASERLQRAVVNHRDAVETVALRKARLDEAKAAAEKLADLQAELDSVEAELADWNRLAADLGKDGLQAVEVDSALGELSDLANELLHSCHGPRWTIRFDSQRLSGDGKKLIETLDILVIDTENGRDDLIETYSGGEFAILAEATALALTVLACRRFGIEGVTLVRDESGAPLDPENAAVYVQMLRKAAAYVRADKILAVIHQPEIADLFDARIDMGLFGCAVPDQIGTAA